MNSFVILYLTVMFTLPSIYFLLLQGFFRLLRMIVYQIFALNYIQKYFQIKIVDFRVVEQTFIHVVDGTGSGSCGYPGNYTDNINYTWILKQTRSFKCKCDFHNIGLQQKEYLTSLIVINTCKNGNTLCSAERSEREHKLMITYR